MKKLITLIFCAAIVLSLSITAGAERAPGDENIEIIHGIQNGLVGEITDEMYESASAKAAAVDEIQEIHDRSVKNGSISNGDYARMKELLNEFYPDAFVENYIPVALICANPDVMILRTLNFPSNIQEDGLWIGTAIRCVIFQCCRI